MRNVLTRPTPVGPYQYRWYLIALISIGLSMIPATANVATAQTGSTFEPTWYVVVDWANLLDEGQEASAINDTWRLNLLGVPAQIVTELEASTPELARQRAATLLIEHQIESAPGADDGILVYAAANPANRSLVTVAIAVGANALPTGGLTEDDILQIQSSVVLPQLTAGHPARAIVYSIREMLYQQVFTPPPSAPRTGLASSLHDLLPWLAPVIAVPAAFVSLRNVAGITSAATMLRRMVLPLGVGTILAFMAIWTRSTPGIFWAIGLILVSVAIAIVADRWNERQGRRVISASPRPPARFTSISRTNP